MLRCINQANVTILRNYIVSVGMKTEPNTWLAHEYVRLLIVAENTVSLYCICLLGIFFNVSANFKSFL